MQHHHYLYPPSSIQFNDNATNANFMHLPILRLTQLTVCTRNLPTLLTISLWLVDVKGLFGV